MNGSNEPSLPARPLRMRVLRALKKLGWVSLFLVVLAIASTGPLVFIAIDLAASKYWQWHAGYGFACDSKTIAEAISPSKRWIARTRHVYCSGFASGGEWVEAVLIPNDLVPLFSRYRRVFSREFSSLYPLPKGSGTMTAMWIDDHSLELRTPPCAPSCHGTDEHSEPCDDFCRVTTETDGIAISVKP